MYISKSIGVKLGLSLLLVCLIVSATFAQQRQDRQEPSELKRLPTMKFRSIEQIRKSVAALYEQDVAWRKIDWETCLLSGIQKSRNQKKPILLWVFIDRPIDDERC